jgi:glucuronoarabinoxylan endo-1,4-beta-xylanase
MIDGAFVYDGFAKYWTDSLAAYRNLGINPTWISIQNEPDWIAGYDSCRFDPTESVVNGIAYAGYDKALEAVADALADMDSPPVISGPEVLGIGYNQLTNYMANLDPDLMGAIAHHLYHGRTVEAFDSVRSTYGSLPRFQTEFSGRDYDGFRLAELIHDSLVVEETSVYLHWGAVWPDLPEFPQELIHIDFPWDPNRWTSDRGWKANDQFYAMEHFSRYVQPGSIRYTAWTNEAALRVSAFGNPDMSRIVVVALNTSDSEAIAPTFAFDGMAKRTSAVYRTRFADFSERFEMTGELDASDAVNLPAQSAATILFDGLP